MIKLNTKSKFALATFLGLSAMATTTTASQAMVLQNCISDFIEITVTGQNSKKVINLRMRPGQKKSFQTGRGEKWHVNINTGSGSFGYSNQPGNAVKSIVRIAGNIEITAGLKCEQKAKPKPAPRPQPGPDEGGDHSVSQHIQFCMKKYRSYNPEDNSWVDFNGTRRPCISPFLN